MRHEGKGIMKTQLIFIALLIISIIFPEMTVAQNANLVLDTSRNNTVKIIASDLNSVGTGFFLDPTHVVTCFHVIAIIQVDPNKTEVRFNIARNINVTLNDDETIPATLVSIPSQNDALPLSNDFAILKLSREPKTTHGGLTLYKEKAFPSVGTEIIFSGYPLGAPTMLTHKGYISGIDDDQSIICIQASVNKGNSGGALLTTAGEVIGIISNREGYISAGLANVTKQITALEEGQGGIKRTTTFGGVNTLSVTKELIATLDKYISTGIGYARSIKPLQTYLEIKPDILK